MTANKVPQIRFKGFSGEWEEKDLCDIIDLNSGRDYKHLKIGNIPVYGTGGYMLSINEALSYNEDAIGIGRKGTIDKPYVLNSPFWTVDTLFYAVPKKENYLPFVYSIFQKINWKEKDESTGVPSLSKIAINNIQIFSTKINEQTKIGDYFQKLDKLIEQKEKKHQKLKQFKKAMLEKMFPKDGEDTPEIRFKGFSGEWEEKEINELFTVTRGDVLAATETSSKKSKEMPYPVYSSQTKNNGLLGFYKKYLFDNAITWTTDGANAGTVKYRNGKFYSTNVNGVLLSDEGYANQAIAEILNCIAWKHVSYVGNPKLMNNVMSKIKIFVPSSIKEQNYISDILIMQDKLINLHEKELEKLKNIKKASLNKMFV